MEKNTEPLPLKTESTFDSLFSHLFPGGFLPSILGLMLLLLVGWIGHETVEREVKNNLSAQLQTTLNANVVALKLWIENKRSDSKVWSKEPTVKNDILSLAEKTSNGNWNGEKLLQTRELKRLRQLLRPVCEQYGYIGFVLINKTGLQIAALLDEPVGKHMLIDRSDFVKRSLKGETLVSLPFPGEVALPDIDGEWRTDFPTMFVSTPVRDEEGKIVAVFSFRIRPETEFSRILETSRTGLTGETYAFDANGSMISDSRFNEQMKASGLLPNRPHSHSILNVHLHDPSPKQISKNRTMPIPREHQPLTKMAASATKGESGFDVRGYSNYQGIPVIGAWTWLPQYHFGLATEIQLEEAFKPLNILKIAFIFLFVLLIISLSISLILRIRQRSIEHQRNQAEKVKEELNRKNQLILEAAGEGIYGLDMDGRTTFINPSAARMIGYHPEELIGKYLHSILHHSKKNGDPYPDDLCPINQAFKDGQIHHSIDEVFWKKDGTCFPVEYISTPIWNEGKIVGAVVMFKDITERRKSEEQLKSSWEQLRKLYSHLQSVREEERTRIAREVHDELGQDLTAIKMDLSWLGEKFFPENKLFNEKIHGIDQLLDTTIETVQRISGDLRPPILDVLGLTAAIEWQAQLVQKRTGIKYIFKAHPENITLDKERSTDIFRIFQETLTNVTRHSQANEIQIGLNHTNGHVLLEVKDNGRGISEREVQDVNSLGLTGMRERANLWKGKIQIIGTPGKGTTVQLDIPCAKN